MFKDITVWAGNCVLPTGVQHSSSGLSSDVGEIQRAKSGEFGICKKYSLNRYAFPFMFHCFFFFSSDRLKPFPGPEQSVPFCISAGVVQCQIL